jgi:hypothetical protein
MQLWVHLGDRTLVYDAEASKVIGEPVWSQLTSAVDGFSEYRAGDLVWCYDKWLVADPLSTAHGYLVDTLSSQWGAHVRWEFGTQIVYNGSRGAIIHELELVALPGRTASVSPPPAPPAAPSTIISRVGLEAEYLFTGGSLLDTSAKARHLTTFTNLAFASDGKGGLDLSFVDRSVIREAYGNAIDLSAATSFSIAFEANMTAAAGAGNPRVLSFGVTTTDGVQLYVLNGTNTLQILESRAGGDGSDNVLNAFDATVREYVFTWDNPTKTWAFYKDGISVGGGAKANPIVMPNRPIVLGNLNTPTTAATWIGLIGKVRLYSRVLTPAEALSLAQNPRQI